MEFFFYRWLKLTWFRESLFFILLFAVFTLGDNEGVFGSWKNFATNMAFFSILYVHALMHRFWLFPILFDKKQRIKYAFLALICLLVFSGITYLAEKTIFPINNETIQEEIKKLQELQQSGNYLNYWGYISLNVFTVIFISSIYFILRYFEQEKKEAKTQLLINQLEINQLRGQLNPHFMFNTLNNLYGVSLEQPDRTPDLILKLSQMMRYQIEASRKEYVSLNEEIEFIESYIAIENERVSNRCTLHFEKNVGQNDLKIAPILLLPFVENAFKHGTTSAEKSFINIKIDLLENPQLNGFNTDFNQKMTKILRGDKPAFLSLKIENSIPQKKKNIASTGIGLENVQQRLLRLYSYKHALEINPTTTTFTIHLEIKLHA
jgi:two-component system, LytTR family, sensor kinase